MLQWMGGSRRKVTASRKSTQKRQQQFFEQKKRQQQQQEAITVECRTDDPVAYAHQNGKRSLDILSLFDVPKVAEECRPACVTERRSMMTDRAPCPRSFKAVGATHAKDLQISMRSPIVVTNEVAAAHVEPIETRTLSSHQVERLSSKGSSRNTSMAKNEQSKCKIDSSIQPSILDIVGDDESINASEGKPVHEAHVAFSVEGLGDLGTETPKQSPQQPSRLICEEKSSFNKAARNLHFRKNLDSMLNDLEMEAECFVQDTEVPTCGNQLDSFLMSEDMLSPLSYTEHELSSVKAGKKHSAKQWEINSLHEDRDTSLWNAGSPFLDKIVDNENCGLNWRIRDANILRNVSPGFRSEEPQLLPRSQENISARYTDLDEGYRDFDRYSSFTCDYKPQATTFSPYMDMEDRRNSLTSLSSEESCSSSAVRGQNVAGMPSERQTRRYSDDLPWQLNSNGKENFREEVEDIFVGAMRGDECDRSKKYRRSNTGHTKSAYISQTTVNKSYCLEDSWLLEEEFPLDNTDKNPVSFFPASRRNRHQPRERDPFGTNLQADLPNSSRSHFGMFDNEACRELSPENTAFFQPFDSKQSLNASFSVGGTCRKSSRGVYRNINIPLQPKYSEDVADFFGDTEAAFSVPDLSAQGSVTEEVGDKLESNPENITQNMNTSRVSKSTDRETKIQKNGSSICKESNDVDHAMVTNTSEEDAEETSLPVMVQHESENELNTKELHRRIPDLCRQNLRVSVGDVGSFAAKHVNDGDFKGFEPKTRVIQPSCQVMTVERYVLQLFCVSQQTAAMWDTTKRLS